MSPLLYEHVSVSVAGLSESELQAVKVTRVNLRGRSERLARPRHSLAIAGPRSVRRSEDRHPAQRGRVSGFDPGGDRQRAVRSPIDRPRQHVPDHQVLGILSGARGIAATGRAPLAAGRLRAGHELERRSRAASCSCHQDVCLDRSASWPRRDVRACAGRADPMARRDAGLRRASCLDAGLGGCGRQLSPVDAVPQWRAVLRWHARTDGRHIHVPRRRLPLRDSGAARGAADARRPGGRAGRGSRSDGRARPAARLAKRLRSGVSLPASCARDDRDQLEHWLFDARFPTGRTALFFVPLYMLLVVLALDAACGAGRVARACATVCS